MDGTRALLPDLLNQGEGCITAAEGKAWGVDAEALMAAAKRGDLDRVGRGAYMERVAGGTPESAHVRRALAVLRTLPTATVLTHHSALAYWGLPTCRADLSTVHVGRIGKPSVTRAAGRRWHRLPEGTPLEASATRPARAVSPAVAVLQVACGSTIAGVVAADAALRHAASDPPMRGRATREELMDALTFVRRQPGVGGARRVIEMADAGAESPGESLLRHDLRLCGFEVETQFLVATAGHRYRADMRVVGSDVLVEYDGEGKYEAADAWTQSKIRRDERRRESDLRRAGWRIARFTRHDLGQFSAIRRRIDEAK